MLHELSNPAFGQVEHLVELSPAEDAFLAGSLDLDEPWTLSVVAHDHVEVDDGPTVLVIGQIQHRRVLSRLLGGDDSYADGR